MKRILVMPRRIGGAAAVLFVLAFLFASAAATKPTCCDHFHQWAPPDQKPGCAAPEQDAACSKWCQSSCRGGECKIRDGGEHVCHCYC